MHRRTLIQSLATLAVLPLLPACSRAAPGVAGATTAAGASGATTAATGAAAVTMLEHPHSFWRDKVSPAAFGVLFNEDTEPAGSSPLDREHREGTFICAACHLPLFDSADKFDSGTGWPSFTKPIAGHMRTRRDFKLVWPRTEYHCARCGGHQGHVFKDGPRPRGERWCNNGLALAFVPEGRPMPALRG